MILILVGFPIALFISASSIFKWIPGPTGGYLFGLIKLWSWRAAFNGVYLMPKMEGE